MKNILFIFVTSALLFAGCKKEEVAYPDSVSNLYFADALYPLQGGGYNAAVDTSGFTFAFATAATVDSFFQIQLNLQGAPASVDREYKVTVDPASTAVAGIHYTLPEHFIFRANRAIDTMRILLHRKPEMKTKAVTLIAILTANENFTVEMPTHVLGSGKTISFIQRKIVISDILTQPKRWQIYTLGVYSAKKLYLMNEILGTPLGEFNTYSGTDYYWSIAFHRWLQEQKAIGKTVYEADGVTEMKMGAYVN